MSPRTQRGLTPAMVAGIMVVAFVVIVGCAIAAGELLALAERSGGSTPIDARITTWMAGHRSAGLTTLARWCSAVGSNWVLVPVVVIGALALIWRRRLMLGGLLIAAWGGSVMLSQVTKAVVGRHRPPTDLRVTAASGWSFPSGHATQSLSTYVALVVVTVAVLGRGRVAGWVLAGILAAGVGWSRVYLGVHWATDVVAGWLIAAAWTSIAVWVADRRVSSDRALTPPAGLGH